MAGIIKLIGYANNSKEDLNIKFQLEAILGNCG